MPKMLTAAAVGRLRPAKARLEIPDGGAAGLYLVIQPSGIKSWALRFRRPNGKTAKLTLGRVDLSSKQVEAEPALGAPLTLAAARRLAGQLQHERARGKDVVAARHREKIERAALVAKTFAEAAFDFTEQHLKRRVRGWQSRARLIGVREGEDGLEIIPKSLADRWRDRPLAEITGDDIHGVIDEAREKGVPGLERRAEGASEAQGRAMHAALSKMFSWLVGKRRIASSPVVGVHKPENSEPRDRVLTSDEVVKFWKAAEAERPEVGAILKLLLLTGQRLGEVRGMRRPELNDDGTSWTIPGERTKNHRTHIVPLPPAARAIIPDATGELVFTTDGKSPITIGSKIKSRLDARMKIAPWRLHDLRRTAATGMAEIGVAPHVVEAVLNHVSGHRAGVAGIYNRAQYAAEKTVALERWAAHVGDLVTGAKAAKIVPMRKA